VKFHYNKQKGINFHLPPHRFLIKTLAKKAFAASKENYKTLNIGFQA